MDETGFFHELAESYANLPCEINDVRAEVWRRINGLRPAHSVAPEPEIPRDTEFFPIGVGAAAALVILAGSGVILYGVHYLIRDLLWTGQYYALFLNYF
ncbi:MAG: hypothetical protein LBT97_04235 [Planctomycetota bacterium]|jgi:hypothetical protein|nr:hypothetical protein [Planctomycetota bacterium]